MTISQPARLRPPTRTDVARRAGVSNAVVSYVVNDGPRPVAGATRERVMKAISELGYRPNASARALKMSQTKTIGLLVRDNVNPFFAEFAHAVEDGAFSQGYAVLLGNSSGSSEREHACISSFLDRAVDGLMVMGVSAAPDLAPVIDRGTPLVVLDQFPPRKGLARVAVDNMQGARMGTDHLIGHGHRRIACLAGPTRVSVADERVQGWREAMHAAHLSTPRTLLTQADFTREGGYRAMRELLTSRARPTAVLAGSDVQAVGALRAICDAGQSVPDDIAVVSFDGTEESAYTEPPLTVIQQPLAKMAALALSLVLGEDCSGLHTLDVDLVVRRSCGCHPGQPAARG